MSKKIYSKEDVLNMIGEDKDGWEGRKRFDLKIKGYNQAKQEMRDKLKGK